MGRYDIENANLEMTYGSSSFMDGYNEYYVEEPVPDEYYDSEIERLHQIENGGVSMDIIEDIEASVHALADEISDGFYAVKDTLHGMNHDLTKSQISEIKEYLTKIRIVGQQMTSNLWTLSEGVEEIKKITAQ